MGRDSRHTPLQKRGPANNAGSTSVRDTESIELGYFLRTLCIAVVKIIAVLRLVGCASAPTAQALPAATPPPAVHSIAADDKLSCPVIAPAPATLFSTQTRALAWVTMNRDARVSIAALDDQGTMTPLTAPELTGTIRLSADGRSLAVERMQGPDSRENRIEIASLVSSRAWELRAGEGCSIFGFALDPSGGRIAYMQIAMRGTLKPTPWQITVADLANPEQSKTVKGDGPAALVPFAWPERDTLLLQARVPFQAAGEEGLWRIRPDGSGLVQLLQESDYVGEPTVSADGAWLAFLSVDIEALPPLALQGTGEPPANRLLVKNLASGEMRALAQADGSAPSGALSDPVWANGQVYFARGEWKENAFVYGSIERAALNPASSQTLVRLTSGQALGSWRVCGDNSILYSIQGGKGDTLEWRARDAVRTIAAPSNTEIDILSCMDGNLE